MKILAAVLTFGLLVSCNTAFAGDIDLSTWTCKKFQAADKDDIGVILAWLDGTIGATTILRSSIPIASSPTPRSSAPTAQNIRT